MPKTKRDLLKRQIAHAHNDIHLAIDHIAQVGIEFEHVHPELEEGLELASKLLYQVDEIIKAFVFAAWGHDDPAWDSWRNVGVRRSNLELQEDDDRLNDEPIQAFIKVDLRPGMQIVMDESYPTGYREAREGDNPDDVILITASED